MSYVRRPSSRSNGVSNSCPMTGPIASSEQPNIHPPKRKPPVGSSSGPPGACMTPSSDWNTAPVSLRIRRHAFDRCIERGDVDLAHRHHRVERALASLATLRRQLHQALRRNLPREAEAVLAP